MRAGFVISSSKQNFKPMKNQPLGALYLLTILEGEFKDIELELVDLRGIPPDNAIYHIPEKDLYFYSVTSPDFPDIRRIVKEIREVYPNAKHVAGGPHIEVFKEQTLGIFDAISLGEGEETIKRIVRDYKSSRLSKVYCQQEEIDLNAYPYPSRKYLPKSAVAEKDTWNKNYQGILVADILFSKGCPFNCYFCGNLVPRKTRFKSPEKIVEEIMYLKREYGVEGLAIKDDQGIHTDVNVARPILEAIKKTGVIWRGQSRANGVSPDMVRLAKESGCSEIAVGIESVSQKVLEIINKRIDFDKAKEYLSLLKKEGIDRKLLLMIGLPGEPDDIADRTIDFIKETEPTNVLLSLFCPMPGSRIYHHPEEFGIKLDQGKEFDRYRTAFGRFNKEETPETVFEYEKETPFGRGMGRQEIIDNYTKVQEFLRKSGLNF